MMIYITCLIVTSNVHTIQPGGIDTYQAWDENSLLASFTDDKSQPTLREYNALDLLTKETQPDATYKQWTWDVAGNNTGIIDANGTSIANTFDDINRLTSRTITTKGAGVEGVNGETFGYNGLSQITTASNDYSSVTMTYNSIGWMTEEAQQITGSSARTEYFLNHDMVKLFTHSLPAENLTWRWEFIITEPDTSA
jgi:YD repeat-containing protein